MSRNLYIKLKEEKKIIAECMGYDMHRIVISSREMMGIGHWVYVFGPQWGWKASFPIGEGDIEKFANEINVHFEPADDNISS